MALANNHDLVSIRSGSEQESSDMLFLADASAKADASARPKVSLIIPTLNEAENLNLVLPTIPSIVDEVVIVDSESTDGTLAVVRELCPDAVIVTETRRGKGHALRTGFETSTGDIIVMMDADGSMNVADIGVFVAALNSGVDVVKGSRFLQGGGSSDLTLLRTAGNLALTHAVRLAFGGRYTDLCYGYMAFWRHVLPAFDDESVSGFEIETFLNIRALAAGLRVAEVASFESPRVHGESNLRTFRDGARALRTIVRERIGLRRARSGLGVPRPLVPRVQTSTLTK
ncbi:glycosyltransferase family 2 protein [Glutamicibacter sp.]|uniref:glycosyltransferase family 2 protein n=1 Tax=Glutamicibacter sp. TaxID=1931995 RepID=UPI0028BE257E|nr:glycosyltransferase family 2 protein [Glutamicibacter sp.]